MLLVAVAIAFAALGWMVARDHYRGLVQDARDAVEHERRMRKYEEERAETLSNALFDRAQTRTKRISGLMN